MELNWTILFIAALMPLIIGMIWYNSKVFGKHWLKAAEITEEKAKSGNMVLIFILTYLFGLFVSITLVGITIHQFGFFQVLEGSPGLGEPGTDIQNYVDDFIENYGNHHRNWSHGLIHGGWTALTFALPLIAISALYERRGWKYICIHFGYWFFTLSAMAILISVFM